MNSLLKVSRSYSEGSFIVITIIKHIQTFTRTRLDKRLYLINPKVINFNSNNNNNKIDTLATQCPQALTFNPAPTRPTTLISPCTQRPCPSVAPIFNNKKQPMHCQSIINTTHDDINNFSLFIYLFFESQQNFTLFFKFIRLI